MWIPFCVCLTALAFFSLGTPLYMSAVEVESLVAVAKVGSFVSCAVSVAACCLTLGCGVLLAKHMNAVAAVHRMSASNPHSSAKAKSSSNRPNPLSTRILVFSCLFALCLLLQAVLFAVSVTDAALTSNAASDGITAAFHGSDLLCIVLALLLFAPAVAKRRRGASASNANLSKGTNLGQSSRNVELAVLEEGGSSSGIIDKEADGRVAQLEEALAQSQQALAEKEKEQAQSQQALAEKEKELAQKEEALAQSQQALAEKEKELADALGNNSKTP